MRGQHPYRGPTGADIPVLIAFIVVNFAATVAVRSRATAGVTGQTRFSTGEIVILVLAFVAAVVAMTALGGAGVSFAWYPTSVLVIPGLAWTILSAARQTGSVSAPGSPSSSSASWARSPGWRGPGLVAAVGLCVVLLGMAAAIAWQQQRA